MSATTANRNQVPLGQKAAFGAGMHLANNLIPGLLEFLFFLSKDRILAWIHVAGLIVGIPRLFDAITDP